MNKKLKELLISIAKERTLPDDPSHDFSHVSRVLKNAEKIAKKEKADLDIVVPAALYHDIVNYPKTDPRAKVASDESADEARKILEKIESYPKEKIEKVCAAIKICSFSKAIVPDFIEAKVLQDADGLESTGAISIMRTFCSTGQYKRPFFDEADPFCEKRSPYNSQYALDLFYSRLLVVQSRFHTETAKKMGLKRTKFLNSFLKELKYELK